MTGFNSKRASARDKGKQMKYMTEQQFESMKWNVIWFAVYALGIAVLVLDLLVWRP